MMGVQESSKVIRAITRVDLLLIDDLGLKPLRAPSDEDLHENIDECYERKATIVTSNLDVSEWRPAFPSNQLIAVGTIDRLRHRAYQLTLEGDTWRTPRPANTAEDTTQKSPKTGQKNTPKTA